MIDFTILVMFLLSLITLSFGSPLDLHNHTPTHGYKLPTTPSPTSTALILYPFAALTTTGSTCFTHLWTHGSFPGGATLIISAKTTTSTSYIDCKGCKLILQDAGYGVFWVATQTAQGTATATEFRCAPTTVVEAAKTTRSCEY